jgi:hypothetical protein
MGLLTLAIAPYIFRCLLFTPWIVAIGGHRAAGINICTGYA